MASSCLRIEDYTVGWISALPLEFRAATQMLDERHQPLLQDVKDMVYVFGSIGSVNVVMACLPAGQYGNESAAVVAADIRSRFPRLWFCLMVGIGGGVPSSNNDIRLGDVVVSQPNATSGGVIQYDLGKSTPDGFERTGSLNAPSDLLLRLLSLYQAKNMENIATKTTNFTSHQLDPRMARHLPVKPSAADRLFLPEYDHTGGQTCDSCDQAYIIERTTTRTSMVHYGTIASGNQVIKTARERDKLNKNIGGSVLCFEMEAAGIMRALPCLVIRGICDYADSHKNKVWQPYAASIAAAFAKDFFSMFNKLQASPYDALLAQTTSSHSTTRRRSKWKEKTAPALDLIKSTGENFDLVETDYFMKRHISRYDATSIHRAYIRRRCPGTTQWIFNHSKYLKWHSSSAGCLWLSGKLGSGKSFTMSTVIQKLLEESVDRAIAFQVIHYFFQHSQKSGLTAKALLDSFIQQVLNILEEHELECPSDVNLQITKHYRRQDDQSDIEDIFESILKPLTATLPTNIIVIVDGIDECEDAVLVLRYLARMNKECKMKILVSMREGLDIKGLIPGISIISITESDYSEEVRTYIDWRVAHKSQERFITEDEGLLRNIKELLVEKADGMILWVTLQIEDIWERCFNDAQIRSALTNLPKDLNETYRRCISKIQSRTGPYACDYAAVILPWIQSAIQPFTILELRQALAVDRDNGSLIRDRIPSAQTTLRSCANLIVADIVPGETIPDNAFVHLVHHSFRQFFDASDTLPSALQDTDRPSEKEDVSLATLCLRHLSSADYTLSIQKHTTTTVHLDTSQVEQILDWTPSFLRPFMRRAKPVTMRLPSLPQGKEDMQGLPAIFHYARSQWPYLTRHISPASSLFQEFQNIVLQPSMTFRLHPWQPLGQSFDSHILGLVSWSIVNHHPAMFGLAPVLERFMAHPEILVLPIPEHSNYNMVILAIRHNAVWALDRLLTDIGVSILRPILLATDLQGWNALLHAADTRAIETLKLLVQKLEIPHPSVIHNVPEVGTLSIAVETRDLLFVQELLGLEGDSGQRDIYNAHRYAIEKGLSEILMLIDDKYRYYWQDTASQLALNHAVSMGHSEVIRHIFASTSYPPFWKQVCIDRAAKEERISMVERMLQADSSLRTQQLSTKNWPNSLLVLAIRKAAVCIVNRWSSPLQYEDLKVTVLQALDLDKASIAAKFLTKYYKISPTTTSNDLQKVTPRIIISRDELLLTALLRFGVDIVPCLHETVWSTHEDMLRLCLAYIEHVVDFKTLDSPDEAGRTLLMKYAQRNNIGCVRVLLETNGQVNVNETDHRGETAISLCCIEGISHYDCAKLLVQYGARLRPRQMIGPVVDGLLLEGILVRYLDLPSPDLSVERSVELLPLPGAGKSLGLLPLIHEAIRYGNFTLLHDLLQNGHHANARDSAGRTLLHTACATGKDLVLFDLLLNMVKTKQLDIDAQDIHGDTPLHLALRLKCFDRVELLLKNRAQIHIENKLGQSAYYESQRLDDLKVDTMFNKALEASEASTI